MCGIQGLLYFDPERAVGAALLAAMSGVATHRGPDDHGVYRRGSVGLAANRLKIIDLAGGHQPMANRDGTAWIVFNGEIYNFPELRDELTRAGHRFRTRSDTETLLHAWDAYGEDCVRRLRGMFAFAIWDERRQVLFAARDRIGIKPFYYYADHEKFAFASEIKSLLQIPEIPRELDPAGLADYLRHGYVIGPQTVFRHIRKLDPAHTITVRPGRVTIDRYWSLRFESSAAMGEPEAREELDALLGESIEKHLISDVPLGVFLSGGVDSSAIVALMSRLGRRDIKTFSIGYDSSESELAYARVVAEHFGTEHHEVRLTPAAFRQALPRIVWHLDEPLADAPSIPMFHLSERARRDVKVVLSGEGADEIFGGYPIYQRMLMLGELNRLPLAHLAGRAFERWAPPGRLRKNAAMLGRPLESSYRTAVIFPLEDVARLLPGERTVDDPHGTLAAVHARCHRLDPLSRMAYVDLNTWLPCDLLLKADRMSMAHSLELRVPFLDHTLVEFAARLPGHLKLRRGTTKYLLKRTMERYLPAEIVHRPKKGFPIPTKMWFRTALAGFVRERLLASDGACLAFFPRDEVIRVLDAHRLRDCSDQIYALLVFDEWYRTFTPVRRGLTALGAVAS